jgi:hypothetical protein
MPRSKRKRYIKPQARGVNALVEEMATRPYQVVEPGERQPIRDAMEDQWERGVATVAAGYAELRRVFLETRDFDRANQFIRTHNDFQALNDCRRAQTIRIGELANELKACKSISTSRSRRMAQQDNRLLREKNEQLARAAQRIVELSPGGR